MTARAFFNALAFLGTGTFTGVMLAIGVIVGGHWKRLPATEFFDAFSTSVPLIMRTIPIALLPVLVGLGGSVWLAWRHRSERGLWLTSSGCILVVLVLTATCFRSTNAQFTARSASPDQVSAMLTTWLRLHFLRVFLGATATILGTGGATGWQP